MFSDIEGSTPLNELLGDETWILVLAAHNNAIERAVRRSGGRVVKKTGDGYMVAFANPQAGVRCACAIRTLSLPHPLRSTGFGCGSATHWQGDPAGRDFLGREVNYAARVASVASGGEVLVSSIVRERIAAEGWPSANAVRSCSGVRRRHRSGR
jgi:class 3 adenylate cyclase